MKINSGIYKFQNKINGKIYIGQTKYLDTRYRQHKCELLKGIHHNPYLQNAVNQYGFENFDYSIVKKCDVNELDYWEEYYFNFYNSQNRDYGYNIKNAGNESDLPEETKVKIKLANRGKNCKLTAQSVEDIKLRRLSGERCKDLAEQYNVTISTINKITMCKNWVYIREDLNESLLKQSEVELLEIERNIKLLYNEGLRPTQIKRQLNISITVVNKVLKNELSHEKYVEKLVVDDFMNMKKVNDILSDRNITYPQYKRITKGLKPKRDLLIYNKIIKLKAQKVMIKDIAEILHLNRCTINEICKKFSNHANTEVIAASKDVATP